MNEKNEFINNFNEFFIDVDIIIIFINFIFDKCSLSLFKNNRFKIFNLFVRFIIFNFNIRINNILFFDEIRVLKKKNDKFKRFSVNVNFNFNFNNRFFDEKALFN